MGSHYNVKQLIAAEQIVAKAKAVIFAYHLDFLRLYKPNNVILHHQM